MNKPQPSLSGVQHILVGNLLLDGDNPRLPEKLRGGSQSELLNFLREKGVLEELAQSYLDNGFFQHEPLIVLRADDHGKYTVVEGNRRLAALKILHEAPEADDIHFVGIDPTPAQLEDLEEIPCFPVSERDEIHAYIGFRHIGGLKTWSPEAKARYVLAEVRKLAERGVADPFRALGRRVGSNTQGARNSYLAIRILFYAREGFGLNVAYVQEQRFGVWLRCMNSADIRTYIGLNGAGTYQEVEEALNGIQKERLAEVLGDLTSGGGASPSSVGGLARRDGLRAGSDERPRARHAAWDGRLELGQAGRRGAGAGAARPMAHEGLGAFLGDPPTSKDGGRFQSSASSHGGAVAAGPLRTGHRQRPDG